MYDGIEIHFEHRLVLLSLKHIGDAAEVELGCTLHQDKLILEVAGRHFGEEIVGGEEKACIGIEKVGILHNFLADADNAAHILVGKQLGNVLIDGIGHHRLMHHIRENHGGRGHGSGASRHEVESRSKRIEVAGVAVGDYEAVVHTFNHIEARAHASEVSHALGNCLGA